MAASKAQIEVAKFNDRPAGNRPYKRENLILRTAAQVADDLWEAAQNMKPELRKFTQDLATEAHDDIRKLQLEDDRFNEADRS